MPAGDIADPRLTAEDLVAATGGRAPHHARRKPIRGGAVDSREVVAGNLFVALPGERTDGHAFLGAAPAAGAAARIVARPPDGVSLDDSSDRRPGRRPAPGTPGRGRRVAASLRPARGRRDRLHREDLDEGGDRGGPRRRRSSTLKNEGNLNNEIGLPLTVLRLRPEHQAAVLEMGMYVGGEIAELAAIGRPEIGVVTAVQPVHLSRIGTIEAIEQAKGELVEALPPDGVAILNADDERVRRMASRTAARVVTYGFAPGCDGPGRRTSTRPAPTGCASLSSPTARDGR